MNKHFFNLIFTVSLLPSNFASYNSMCSTTAPCKTNDCFILNKKLDKPIKTFECLIKLPHIPDNDVGGIIFGNYYNNKFDFGGTCDYLIDKNGHFRIFWNYNTKTGAEVDHTFTNYDFRTNNWEYIALTRNSNNGEIILYVNGYPVESFIHSNSDSVSTMKFGIGCDWTNWHANIDGVEPKKGVSNKYPFKGDIKQIALFDTIRTNDQIKDDINLDMITTNNLIGAWNLEDWSADFYIDMSKNNNNAVHGNFDKYIEIQENQDFDYSFICVPDIQRLTYWEPEKLAKQFDWIVNNVDKYKIKYVELLGDLTDSHHDDDPNKIKQWSTVNNNFNKLDNAEIPYGFVAGNHDYDDDWGNIRSSTKMNYYLPLSKYAQKKYFGGSFDNNDVLNYYNIIKINNIEYLFLNLEFGPRNEVLDWADQIITAHSNARVILNTHSYLEPDGTITKSDSPFSPSGNFNIGRSDSCNDGIDIKNKLLSKHSNIFMVWSGHNPCDDIVYTKEENIDNSYYYSFLIDAQDALYKTYPDLLSIFKVNEKDKKAYVYWYSPSENKYLNIQNQFVIDLNIPDKSNINLGLILGVSIPCGILLISGIIILIVVISKKKKNNSK